MDKLKRVGQWALLKRCRFLSLFITQFFGAFNDNVYKNFLLMLIAFSVVMSAEERSLLINLAAGLFILPFVLFSFIAGQLADKYDKARLVRCTKLAEVFIMILSVPFILFESYWVLIILLFLMGAQSAFFGPVKYSLLPEYLSDEELMGANALVGGGTFVAILLGMMLSGFIMTLAYSLVWFAVIVVLLAVLGWIGSCFMTPTDAKCPQLIISWNFFKQVSELIRLIYYDRLIFLSIMSISWFWGLGAACLTQFPQLIAECLGGPPEAVSLVLGVFVLGVGAGSLSCDRLLKYKSLVFWQRVSACGLSLGCFALYFHAPTHTLIKPLTLSFFLDSQTTMNIMLDALLIGYFGGMFVVPLYVLIQRHSHVKYRARVIAALNIFNALGILSCALIGMVWMGVFGLSIGSFFLLLAVLNSGAGIYIFGFSKSFKLTPIVTEIH